MGGKGGARPTTGADSITWGPLARANGWGWDAEQPAAAAAPEPAPVEQAAAPEPAAVQEQATPAAPGPQGPIGDPIPPGQATGGSITTTQDTGAKLAQTIAAPSMWTDQLKTQGLNGSGSMTTTGQV